MKWVLTVYAICLSVPASAEDIKEFTLRDHTLKCSASQDEDSGVISGRCATEFIAIEFTSICAPEWLRGNGRKGFSYVYDLLIDDTATPSGNMFTELELAQTPIHDDWAEPTTFLLNNGGLCQMAKIIPHDKEWIEDKPLTRDKIYGILPATGKHNVDIDGRISGYHCNVINWLPYRTCNRRSELFTLKIYDNPAWIEQIDTQTFRQFINLYTSFP